MEQKKRRKGIVIMGQLIGLVKPLLPIMCVAVLLGVLGYLCAIFLTILAGYGILFSFGMLFFMLWSFQRGNVSYDSVLIATIAMMGSFGPVVALSNLSNNLNQTLASGERVLSLLEETPRITEVSGNEATVFEGAAAEQVDFA